jgi:hypothetical protein
LPGPAGDIAKAPAEQPCSKAQISPIMDLEAASEAGTAEDVAMPAVLPSPWARVPPVFIFPRLGDFLIPPSGPGYYSVQDVVKHHRRARPPVFPYPPFSLKPFPFYDADFRYLENPDNTQHDLFDPLKRVHLFDNWLASSGGELRYRYMNEVDSRLSGLNNEYNLYRGILYHDLWFRDQFRLFVEFLSAESAGQDLDPLPIDEDPADLLDAFIDWKLCEIADKNVYLRGGRFEVLLGSERLVSPLDWANTLRNFQGAWLFRQGHRFDFNPFWLQPVLPNPDAFNSVDDDQNFAGLWTTYRPQPGTFLDLYYLNRDFARPDFMGRGGVDGGFNISTIGVRYCGDRDRGILWDFEAMGQFGRWVNQDMCAGAATGGLGYRFDRVPMNPQAWIYYDWASGDANPGQGETFGTFNQLFPFGHYYLGFLDLVGRQNIRDVNCQFAFYPTRWIIFLAQYHRFWLDQPKSPLFNAGGVPIRQDPTGFAGRDVGQEIDMVMNIHIDAHQDILIGYSKLFAGEFIKLTGNPDSPDLFYLQYQFRW